MTYSQPISGFIHTSWVSSISFRILKTFLLIWGVWFCNTLTGQDTVPPVFDIPPRDTSFLCDTGIDPLPELIAWYNSFAGAVASDDSGPATLMASPSLADVINIFNTSSDTLCGNTRSVTVTFTAMDLSGNVSIPMRARFFTFDNIAPDLVIPPNVSYSCIQGIRDTLIQWIRNKGNYTATDNCSNQLNWTIYQYSISTGNTVIQSGGGSIANGPYPNIPNGVCNWRMNINFFVLDECGNQIITPGTTTFTVTDDVAPVLINVPADVTVSCDSVPNVATVTALDYCTQNIQVQFSQNTNRSADTLSCGYFNYEIFRTWTASDNCNNQITATQKITVKDNKAPVITAPANITVSCLLLQTKPDSLYINNVRDNCSPYLISFRDSSEVVSCIYNVFRKYTATDICLNSSEFNQVITVRKDTKPGISHPARNKSFNCESPADYEGEFQRWIADFGEAVVVPVCSDRIRKFAAVPGSYTVQDTLTFPGSLPGVFNPQQCPSQRAGYLRFEEVDFVFYDECANVSVTTATFGISDTLKPVLMNCPENRLISTGADDCMAEIRLVAPSGSDNCIESESPLVRSAIQMVRSSAPGNPESIVDSFTIVLGPFNPNAFEVVSDADFTIDLRSMDIDDVPEFFLIRDEDGQIVGKTLNGPTQCSNATVMIAIEKDKIKRWIQDGRIEFRFVPNIVPDIPVLSINDICTNSQIRVKISFGIKPVNNLFYTYQLNSDAFKLFNPDDSLHFSLSKGSHTITFQARDCANNIQSCETRIEVIDATAPVIKCPENSTLILQPDSCRAIYPLNLDFNVSENCGGNRNYSRQIPTTKEASLISYLFNESTASFVARPRQFIFTDVFPVRYLNKKVLLEIEIFGDVGDAEEHYEVFAPDGSYIGNTQLHQAVTSCGLSLTRFLLDRSQFNNWIQNGSVTFTAIPRVGNAIQGGGINPCRPLPQGQITDGESYIQARLRYTDLTFMLEISGASNQSASPLPFGLQQSMIALNGGINTLRISATDDSGNTGSCSFIVDVQDRQAPVALCRNIAIQISPSGIDPYILSPAEIDAGSRDNCKIASRVAEPSIIDCSMLGNISVLLTVTDIAGNTAQCSSQVLVRTTEIKPTFTSGLCQNDTLKLFANPPPSTVPGLYSYKWSGPNGIEFLEENPYIPNVTSEFNGTYRVTVTGFNGCTSEGSVLVNIQPLINPVISIEKDTICEGENVILNTTAFSGEVIYEWYEGIFPSGILLQKTNNPQAILSPTPGVHFYHVIAQGESCRSNPSAFIRLTVLRKPPASVNNLLLTPCEGENIQLGTSVTGPGFSYQWTGPAGYSETGQNPRIITNAQSINSGIYKLVILNRKCSSDTAFTNVTVLEKPRQPSIAGAEVFCQGSTFNLLAVNSPGADSYEWYKDNVLFRITAQNTITITNAQIALQGGWQVVAVRGNCRSDISQVRDIGIINILEIGASNSGPACEGDSIRLTATFVPNATYLWSGPVPNIPQVQNPLIPAVPGEYSVTISTPTLCQNNASTFVQVISKPTVTAISTNAQSCMDGNTPVSFFPSVFPPEGNYTYEWRNNAGFSSSLKNPIIYNATSQDTGSYFLRIFNQGCPSDPFEVKLSFNMRPPRPVLEVNPFYCDGDTIILSHSGNTPANSFIWNTPTGTINTTQNPLVIQPAQSVHSGQYSLTIILNGCTSQVSEIKTLEVRSRPIAPSFNVQDTVCYGSTVQLEVANIIGASYIWRGPDNFSSSERNPIISNATQNNSGNYYLVVVVNGCTSTNTVNKNLWVRERIETPEIIGSNFSLCNITESKTEICLEASSLTPGAITQLIHAVTGAIISQSGNNCHVVQNAETLREGTNLFYAVATIGGCFSEKSAQQILRLSVPPNLNAEFIEDRITVCPGDFITLVSRHGPPDVDLSFNTPDPDLVIQSNTERSVLVSNLKEGRNTILLHYSVPGCANFTSDTAIVNMEFVPILNDDVYSIPYNRQADLNILTNDKIPSGYDLTIVSEPKHGRVVIRQGFVTFIPDPRFVENVSFIYRVCGIYCENLCAETRVTLNISDAVDCFAPNVITPNKDGYNDAFVVPCLSNDNFPRNQLYVFNQWGTQVFYAAPYKNDWEGTHGGSPLPVGTYYYVLELGDGSNPINGFLILQR